MGTFYTEADNVSQSGKSEKWVSDQIEAVRGSSRWRRCSVHFAQVNDMGWLDISYCFLGESSASQANFITISSFESGGTPSYSDEVSGHE